MALLPMSKKPLRPIIAAAVTARARFGGPRRRMRVRSSVPTWNMHDNYGSHMPLDTEFHFRWRNLANFMPALLFLLMLILGIALA